MSASTRRAINVRGTMKPMSERNFNGTFRGLRPFLRTLFGVCLMGVLLAPGIAGAQLTNPVGCDDIGECIGTFIQYALGLAGVLALAGIVYGGFLYLTAAGNQERVESGKNAVTYSIIGLIIIGLAFAIVNFVFQALGGGGAGGGGVVQ